MSIRDWKSEVPLFSLLLPVGAQDVRCNVVACRAFYNVVLLQEITWC